MRTACSQSPRRVAVCALSMSATRRRRWNSPFSISNGSRRVSTSCGDRAYVVGTIFWVVDISDPTTPVLLGETHFSGFDVEVVGSVAYVAALSRGLVTVDVTNPAIPFEIGNLDFGDDEFEHIDVLGEIAVLRGTDHRGRGYHRPEQSSLTFHHR